MQLYDERKQELIMAKQIRRDTVVIQGGNTTTRVRNPNLSKLSMRKISCRRKIIYFIITVYIKINSYLIKTLF